MQKRKKYLAEDSSDGEMENIDMNEILDSEEELSENERRLLDKVSKRRQIETYDSEDEVMGFDNEDQDDDDAKDSMASDIEGLEQDFDLPNEKAWGKKKKAYYSTDYVDADYASATQKDMATAELEEQEARNLQKQLAEQLDDADFGLDLVETKETSELEKEDEHIKADLSKLSKRQKQELLEKESPEFVPLVTDLKDRLDNLKNILRPFLDLVDKSNVKDNRAVNFIREKYDLLLHYCTNLSFYLMLKSERALVASHPVIKRLAQYRQLLTQLEDRQGDIIEQVKEILEANKNGQPLFSSVDSSEIQMSEKKQADKKSKKPKKVEIVEKANKNKLVFGGDSSMDENEEEDDEMNAEMFDSAENEEENENAGAGTEKRAITYEIAKNKGLTPHRKKEQRNPRVKHRNKYRKAKIRRKGAVREVRKETTRYGGEISGIKASVSKSIKFK